MIPQEKIVEARQTDLVQFLLSKGVQLKQVGRNEYQHPEHDSLYIQGNHFTWFSQGITREKGKEDGRNAITLVMMLFGWSFTEAVQELTGFTPMESPKSFYKPSEDVSERSYQTNAKRAIAYLNKKRGIDYKLIKKLLTSGKLKQDEKGNCRFIIKDFDGNAICDDMHGTGDKRFKGISGSQKDFGFTYGSNNPDELIFFESSIDLLSFAQMYTNKIDNALLVSMVGLKANVLRNYCKHFPNAKITIAVDNDEHGNEFWKSIFEEISSRLNKRYKPQEPYKDWNEMLCAGLEKKARE